MSTPGSAATPSPSALAPFGDGSRVTIPQAASAPPTSLKVAQQPTAVAAAVASQVARETVSAGSAANGPLLRSRDADDDMSDDSAPAVRGTSPGRPDDSGGGSDGPGSSSSSMTADDPMPPASDDSIDTAHNRAWLETHARALYPFIRAEIRGELLRDRERRGRLMREQR